MASLAQDAFTLIAQYLPLASLQTLRLVCRRYQTLSRHPHCYASYVHRCRNLDREIDRLAVSWPSVRAFVVNQAYVKPGVVDEYRLGKLTTAFPALSALSLIACHALPSGALQRASLPCLSSLTLQSLAWQPRDYQCLSQFHSLTALSIIDANIDGDTCAVIATLSLRLLNVSQCTSIDDACVRQLLGIARDIDDELIIDTVEQHWALYHTRTHSTTATALQLPSFAELRQLSKKMTLVRSSSTPILHRGRGVEETETDDSDGSNSGSDGKSPQSSPDQSSRHTHPLSLSLSQSLTLSPPVKQSQSLYFTPSLLSQSLTSLTVAHNRKLSDKCALYLAFLAMIATNSADRACHCHSTSGSASVSNDRATNYLLGLTSAPPIDSGDSGSMCPLCPVRHYDASFLPLITDLSIIALASSLTHLQSLILSHSIQLTDHSVFVVSEACHSLSSLSLTSLTHVTDHSLSALVKLPSLTVIKLHSLPRLTDRSIIALTRLPLLSHFSLHHSLTVSDASILALSRVDSLLAVSLSHLPRMTVRGFLMLARQTRQLRLISVKACSGVSDESMQLAAQHRPSLVFHH